MVAFVAGPFRRALLCIDRLDEGIVCLITEMRHSVLSHKCKFFSVHLTIVGSVCLLLLLNCQQGEFKNEE